MSILFPGSRGNYTAEKQRHDETHGDSPAGNPPTEYGEAEYRAEVMTHSGGRNAEHDKGQSRVAVSLKIGLGLGGLFDGDNSALLMYACVCEIGAFEILTCWSGIILFFYPVKENSSPSFPIKTRLLKLPPLNSF